jgi:hypothetical protein
MQNAKNSERSSKGAKFAAGLSTTDLTKKLKNEQTSNEFDKVIQNFLQDKNHQPFSFNLKTGDLITFYAPIPYHELVSGVVIPVNGERLFPAETQRGNDSKAIKKRNLNEFYSSTWNYDDIASAFISWFTWSSTPVIKINVSEWSYRKYSYIWDGNSKFKALYHFFNNAEIFQILNGNGDFVEQVNRFLEHTERLSNPNGSIEKLKNIFLQFKSDFKVNKKQFLTINDLKSPKYIQLGGADVLSNMEEMNYTIIIHKLDAEQETEAYTREGSHSSEQKSTNLSLTAIRTSWFKQVSFDTNSKPKDLNKKYLQDSIFSDEKLKESAIYGDVIKEIWNPEIKYTEKDEFLLEFLPAVLYQFSTKPTMAIEFAEGEQLIKALANPFRVYAYDYLLDNKISNWNLVKDNSGYVKKIIEIKDIVGKLFSKKVLGSLIGEFHKSKKSAPLTYRDMLTNEIKRVSFKYDKNSDGNLGHRDKLFIHHGNNIINVIIVLTALEIYNNNAISRKEQQIKDFFTFVLNTFSTKWIEYLDSSDSLKKKFSNQLIISSQDIEKFEKNNDWNTPTSFFEYFAFEGGNLEKIVKMVLNFYVDVLRPEIDSSSFATNIQPREQVRRRLVQYLQKKEDWAILSPNGKVITIDNMDIGHCELNSDGGYVNDDNFIPEERQENQQIYKMYSKNRDDYFKSLQAVLNTEQNMLSSKIDTDIREMLNDGDIKPSKPEHIEFLKLKEYKENLKYLLKYPSINIEFNRNIVFSPLFTSESYLIK